MKTCSNEGWNLSDPSQASSHKSVYVASGSKYDTSAQADNKVMPACSKPFKFYRKQPTGSPFDMSFIKFGIPKSRQTKFKDLTVKLRTGVTQTKWQLMQTN